MKTFPLLLGVVVGMVTAALTSPLLEPLHPLVQLPVLAALGAIMGAWVYSVVTRKAAERTAGTPRGD